MIKQDFYSYTRPNGHNEFQEYLNNLPEKDGQKLYNVIKNIEKYGLIKARKNHWFSNIRDTGFIELRSAVGRNQKRGFGFYSHIQRAYILITGFDKKQEQLNSHTIQYLNDLRKEFDMTPKPKITKIEPPKVLHSLRDLKVLSNDTNTPAFNKHFVTHLNNLSNYTNWNEMDQDLHLKPGSVQNLIDNHYLSALPKLSKKLNLTLDDLLTSPNSISTDLITPIKDHCVIWCQQHNQTMRQLATALREPINQLDDKLPYKTIYALANHYRMTIDDLLDVHIIKPTTKTLQTKNTFSEKVYPILSKLLKQVYASVNKAESYWGVNHHAITNLKNSAALNRLQKVYQYTNADFNQLINDNLEKLYANLYQHNGYPVLSDYVRNQILNSSNLTFKTEFETYDFTALNTNASILTFLIAFSALDISINGLMDLKVIKNHNQALVNRIQQLRNIQTNSAINPKIPSESQVNNILQPIVKHQSISKIEPTTNQKNHQNVNDDSRLQRIFNQIEHLDPNQILIINDLIQSWLNK